MKSKTYSYIYREPLSGGSGGSEPDKNPLTLKTTDSTVAGIDPHHHEVTLTPDEVEAAQVRGKAIRKERLSDTLFSSEAPAGYPPKNSNNKKNTKRAGDDGTWEEPRFLSFPFPSSTVRLHFFLSPASLRDKEASAEGRASGK